MQSLLMRRVIAYMMKYTFLPAKRNKAGEMILVQSSLVKWLAFFLFLLATSFFLGQIFRDHLVEEAIGFTGVLTIALGYYFWVLATSKIVVNESTVISCKWYGKKTIPFSRLEQVTVTPTFGGCLILRDDKRSFRVPLEYVGMAEFVVLLREKVGYDKSVQAIVAISERKRQMEGMNR